MTLGLDELIIVNPGAPPEPTSWFLGADGAVYRLDRATASTGGDSQRHDSRLGANEPVPRYFLGDDGVLYERRR